MRSSDTDSQEEMATAEKDTSQWRPDGHSAKEESRQQQAKKKNARQHDPMWR